MALPHAEDDISDDNFYFGQLTFKEIKKHIFWDKTRHNIACSLTTSEQDNFKLIETHSEPNLIHARTASGSSSSKSSNWDIRTSDDTFIKLENLVEGCSKSPDKAECKVELNNTLEVIEYILNHGPPENKDNDKNNGLKNEDELSLSNKDVFQNKGIKVEDKTSTSIKCMSPLKVENDKNKGLKNEDEPSESNKDVLQNKGIKVEDKSSTSINCMSHLKVENVDGRIYSYKYLTPAKSDYTDHIFVTPSSKIKPKSKIQLFKTPGPPTSENKAFSTPLKVTSKSKAYDHISSPVASYINKSPQVPLIKDVRPKKPLTSSIPKYLWKSKQKTTCSTPNINLPSIAYRSAKKTHVIDIPDEEKLPKCQWAKNITSKTPKPVVMKHDHREVNFTRKPLIQQQEDSFANLSYHQADLSVCTQKSAYNLKKD